jgi:hypothetical protein
MSGFSMVGPKTLNEILKKEKISPLNRADIIDLWLSYHENKEGIHGSILERKQGLTLIQRATECPYFIQPVFREEGFFMLLSQFQSPCHFFLAYLEDYKMDPNRASPLITFSIFNDLIESHDLSLLRCDMVNKGIEEMEAVKAVERILECYLQEDEYHTKVKVFNKNPSHFDLDDFIYYMNQKWKNSNKS